MHPAWWSGLCVKLIVALFILSPVSAKLPRAPLQRAAGTFGDTPALSLRHLQRCAGVRGTVCAAYYAQTFEPLQQPRIFDTPCPISPTHGTPCGLGVCHGDTGLCDCPAGVGGPDCSSEDSRPCTNHYRTDRNSSVPGSHIGPNKRDINWREPGWTPSRCAGVCDDATATCFCDGAHFGRVPALPGSPPGSPPIRPGRLLHGNCQRLITDDAGRPLHWGGPGGVKYDDVYGAQGWCTVDKPRVHCSCDLDGYDGTLCDAVTETVCPNQCSGHGICTRGFCKCFTGWFGLDCARLSDPTVLNPGAAAAAAAAVSTAAAAADGSGSEANAAAAVGQTVTAAAATDAGGTVTGVTAAAAAAAAGQAADGKEESAEADSSSGNSNGESSVESTVDSIASAEKERQERQQASTPAAPAASDADANAATAAAAVAAVPEHVRFFAQKPYLSQVIVDPWFASTPQDAAAAASAAETAAAATAAAEQQGSQVHPAVPVLYYTPVSSSSERGIGSGFTHMAAARAAVAAAKAASASKDGSDTESVVLAGGEGSVGEGAVRRRGGARHFRHRRVRRHVRGLKGTQQQQRQRQAGRGFWRQFLSTPAPQQQQQQQQHQDGPVGQREGGLMRNLLRHFWTGGGSQRAEFTLAPKQQTVSAAVHEWLSSSHYPDHGSGVTSDATSSGSSGSSDAGTRRMAGVGLIESLAAAGVQMDKLGSEKDTALLMQMVEEAVGEVPAGQVRRPRIFVYDMPSRFVSRLLQYRSSKQTCTWRVFSKSNFSKFTTVEEESKSAWGYPLESHLHELMLQSPHRTLDPEEADFFYVPVYAACMIEAVAGWADAPWWNVYSKSYVKQGVMMYQDALNWIRTTYPYWNATGGADHIWLFSHDEGACWAPSEIYNASIILTQWGRLGAPSLTAEGTNDGPIMDSWTSKWSQNWNKWHASLDDPLGLPGQDYRTLIKDHPCYTPGKDLVLPAFRPPTLYRASPFMGGDSRRTRDIFLLLRGDMGRGRRAPVRQQLAQLAETGDWRKRYGAWIGTSQELPGEQSALLARSQYCIVLPIDGWSATFEDAVLHGCIPVVINLGARIAQPYSGILRLSSGMIGVARSDLANLSSLLKAISPAEEDALRASISSWWHRVAWLTHPFVKSIAAETVEANLQRHPWVRSDLEQQQQQQQQALAAMGRAAEPQPAAAEGDGGILIPILPSQPEEDSGAGADGDTDSSSSSSSSDGGNGSNGDGDSSDSSTKQVLDGASYASSSSSNSSINSSDGTALDVDAAAGQEGPAERVLTEAETVAELFATRVWQPDAPVDDAFTTLMQWLHHKMLHPYDASRSGAEAASQGMSHTRPSQPVHAPEAEHTATD